MSAYKSISEFYSDDERRTASVIKEIGTNRYIVRLKNEAGSAFSASFGDEESAEQYAEEWVFHSEHYFNPERKQMSKTFTDVEVFLQACGQHHANSPTGHNDLSNLYKKLILEEYTEFIEACMEDDDAEQLDACFDMIWVIIGYMKSRGWDCENIWDEGAKSNLSKIDPVTGLVRRREDGKILKPEGWKPPDFTKFVK